MSVSVREARLLEGKVLAQKIQDEIREFLAACTRQGLEVPRLAVVQTNEDPASQWYVGQQRKLAQKLGIEFDDSLTPDKFSDEKELIYRLKEASRDTHTHGIFITLPLPQGFDVDEVLDHLDPRKDVEGIHPSNLGRIVLRKARLVPSTAAAALSLIEATGVALRGKRAVIIGQSAITGRPVQLLLGERRVTTTVCNTGTSAEDLEKFVRGADLVVACAGQPELVRGEWIQEGAIVIDIGTTEVEGKLVGDVEFEEARKRAGYITPVPGGVGPLTVTMLLQNLIVAYRWQKGL